MEGPMNRIRFVGGPWDGMTMPTPPQVPEQLQILMPRLAREFQNAQTNVSDAESHSYR
jgi:hypothetical protein